MLKTLKVNASQSFVNFILAILASYWVTIFHDIPSKKPILEFFINYISTDIIFLITNVIIVLLAILALHNLYLVVKINRVYIPELKEILSKIEVGKHPNIVTDSFATLHKYFIISRIEEKNKIIEIVVKPIRLNTNFMNMKNVRFSLKFINEEFVTYEEEEGDKIY